MSKPMIHARSSAKRFGGQAEDYIEIHDFIDSSKAAFPDNRHRALTHNSWFIFVVEKVFGHEIQVGIGEEDCGSVIHLTSNVHYLSDPGYQKLCTICDGSGKLEKSKPVSVRDVAEQHILEDFGGKFIPTVADYLDGMEFHNWMNNGIKGSPPSHRKIAEKRRVNKRLVPITEEETQAIVDAASLTFDRPRGLTLD